ncbi:MAG TPA: hypothetical protein VFK02_20440 [Kofleriaceae bacterium]|nr:hypothetical protein [Kofleriaceae bacterium]
MEPAREPSGRAAPTGSARWPMPALGIAAVALVALIALLRGTYLAADDDILIAFFRDDAAAPFVAPVLSQAMGAAYAGAPSVPWFGLWLYVDHALALAVFAGVLLELPLDAPRALRRAGALGAAVLLAGVAALALRVTYASAGITACCAGLVALCAEWTRADRGRPARALWAGAALAAGVATRFEALAGAGAAIAPLVAAAGWDLLRARRLPRPGAIAAGLGPALIVVALGPAMPQRADPAAQRYLELNHARHVLHFQGAYVDLDRRAPEVLAAAGWTTDRFWQFTNRFYFTDDWFTLDRLRRLHDTGGVPQPVFTTLPSRVRDAERAAGYGGALLAAVAAAVLALAMLGRIARDAAALAALHLVWLLAVALALQRWMHFPDRIAVPMAVGAACAAIAAARRGLVASAWQPPAAWRLGWPALALGAAVALILVAARRVEDFRTVRTDLPDCGALEARIAARRPTLVVSYLEPSCARDPLTAAPRPYPSVTLTWPIFSPPFYRGLARLGVTDARKLVPALATHPDAYVLLRRRYLASVTRGLSTPAAGVALTEIDTTGPGAMDLVLAHVALTPGAAPAGPDAR